jgi:hypothetical protein
MKRYQCIKNVVTDGDYIDFKAGNIYEVTFISGFETLVDEYGDTWSVDENLLYHFQELLDLHVDDHEEEQSTALIPSEKALGTGCAICVGAILTVIIYLISLL